MTCNSLKNVILAREIIAAPFNNKVFFLYVSNVIGSAFPCHILYDTELYT